MSWPDAVHDVGMWAVTAWLLVSGLKAIAALVVAAKS